jgi:phosphatidate cytidylyltransferase
MLKRTITALIGAPIFLGLIYLGGLYTAFLVAVLTFLALREFMQIGEQMGICVWHKLTTLFVVVWLIIMVIGGAKWMVSALVFWFLVGLGRMALTYPGTSLFETCYNLLAVFYSVILFSHLYLLCQLPNGIELTFLAVLLAWATDIGAYIIGRRFGSHLLAPKVSPKKTVEGAFGGLLFCLAAALVFWYFIGGASWIVFVSLAVIIGIGAQIGDLYESALKRSAGVKDSGKIIPGHGGVLDRFDSLIFVFPLVYHGFILFMR